MKFCTVFALIVSVTQLEKIFLTGCPPHPRPLSLYFELLAVLRSSPPECTAETPCRLSGTSKQGRI
jgi:hypothetical protein